MTLSASSSVEQMPEWVAILAEHLPQVDDLVTEDDTPVDNLFSAKQQRLLVEPLYTSWAGPGEDRPFLADANVGVFSAVPQSPLVPDAFLSLDVRIPADVWAQTGRSYFMWEYGKPPDVVIEIVSNQKGAEAERKLRLYGQMGVLYYVIFDPTNQLRAGSLQVYHNSRGTYRQVDEGWFPEVGLGVRLWQGLYEGMAATWLRWYDQDGNVLPTGAERAELERQRRAEYEQQRAAYERQRAELERQRAERLAAQLRALGIEPQDI
jgi:Putative restriction endonuclease